MSIPSDPCIASAAAAASAARAPTVIAIGRRPAPSTKKTNDVVRMLLRAGGVSETNAKKPFLFMQKQGDAAVHHDEAAYDDLYDEPAE